MVIIMKIIDYLTKTINIVDLENNGKLLVILINFESL